MDSSLRITFEAFCQFAHRRARGLVAGHVARLILAQAGLVELLPAFHESVGAAAAASRRTEAWRAICSVVLDAMCAAACDGAAGSGNSIIMFSLLLHRVQSAAHSPL